MTYDKLLEKIAFDSAHHLREALRAVVELHKDKNGWCLICNYPYPCKTIQDVEEQLK